MCKKFTLVSLLPSEIISNIIALSDNTGCLSVSKFFHSEFSRKMKARNEKKGLSLLERGSFYGIVLAKSADKFLLSAHAALSGNERLLKKVMMYDKKNCYAGSQENALYCASLSGNRKLALWVRKRFRANCVSGFHGALEGGHTKDALYWWKKMEKKVGNQERGGFLGQAIVRALRSGNKEAVPILVKLGGIPSPDAFDVCAKNKDLETFKLLLGANKVARRERALLAAIRTKDQNFVFACFQAGIQTENMHIDFAQKTDRMMSLLLS
ncbi:hypothetical protein MEL_137 [Melbournevirus]|uniref:hypothetical protein n=1 Tax=Melbournevirus TaxID=1560514 RepID=UPI00051F56DC|nr:hypothetical protein MEL_137 [Melbournevirus]AIT54750.1 ankyrin repeat-containing protein [Melbournevirus]